MTRIKFCRINDRVRPCGVQLFKGVGTRGVCMRCSKGYALHKPAYILARGVKISGGHTAQDFRKM